MKDKELDNYVLEYIKGNNEAFDVIYLQTKKTVYLSVYVIVKEQQIIEDIMQESYLKIIDAIDRYEIGTNFYAWVSKIARNTAINYYNRYKREVLIDPYKASTVFKAPEEENLLLNAALKILEGSEKEVIVYKIVFNMTFKDISSIIDLPMNTVTYIYKKAIKKIKHNL